MGVGGIIRRGIDIVKFELGIDLAAGLLGAEKVNATVLPSELLEYFTTKFNVPAE